MSEAELHRITQRMDQGKRQKARRGARRFGLPIGSGSDASGAMVFDPDAQGQQVVHRMVRTCDERGTLHAFGRSLARHGIELEVRRREGPAKGTLEWRCPTRTTLQAFLSNPL